MKVFLTGATGFLGSHLVDLLLQEGHEVTCLVRSSSNLRWLKGKPVKLVQGDLLPDNAGLREGLKNADWCFHAAGVISTADPKDYYRINAGGTRHCLDLCLKTAPNLKRFVLVSSIAAGGPSRNGVSIDETMETKPLTLYGHSKLEAERIALGFKTRLPVTVIRPPAIYGPRDTMILPVFKMAKQRLYFKPFGKPRYISMAYVEDVAGACLWAAKSGRAAGEIFYVADGDSYPWEDIADTLAQIFHHKVYKIAAPKSILWPLALISETVSRVKKQIPPITRVHIKQFYAKGWAINIDKIKNAGFHPRFNLQEGMKASVAGYRQLGWL
ncbi:MAG: NAD-dependent epimerase/dehydratase family protein [Deltaproteobacteria bacterium]|nr:NAD-dependent epimerase/dehydratase family protein [Deltaproteobacteria bacterium]